MCVAGTEEVKNDANAIKVADICGIDWWLKGLHRGTAGQQDE